MHHFVAKVTSAEGVDQVVGESRAISLTACCGCAITLVLPVRQWKKLSLKLSPMVLTGGNPIGIHVGSEAVRGGGGMSWVR